MSKRTENERKEDALLRMANDWQNFRLTWGKPDAWPMSSDAWDHESADAGASCALSEVAGMGYDLLNADGTDCEKTHEAVVKPLGVRSPLGEPRYYLLPVRR